MCCLPVPRDPVTPVSSTTQSTCPLLLLLLLCLQSQDNTHTVTSANNETVPEDRDYFKHEWPNPDLFLVVKAELIRGWLSEHIRQSSHHGSSSPGFLLLHIHAQVSGKNNFIML